MPSNGISDLISEMEQKNFSREEMILKLRTPQTNAEEKFLNSPEEKMTKEEYLEKQNDIFNTGVMTLLMDRYSYHNVSEVFAKLEQITKETAEIEAAYMKAHKDEIKILHCR